MGIIIHAIKVIWTKESRGEPGASIRNRIPELLSFAELPDSDSIYLQETIFSEYKDFKNPLRKAPKLINEKQLKESDLEIEIRDNELSLTSCLSSSWIKSSYPKKLGNLSYNNWCQIKSNDRIPLESTWSYEKTVLNIFYGELRKVNDIVHSKRPQFIRDYRILLK